MRIYCAPYAKFLVRFRITAWNANDKIIHRVKAGNGAANGIEFPDVASLQAFCYSSKRTGISGIDVEIVRKLASYAYCRTVNPYDEPSAVKFGLASCYNDKLAEPVKVALFCRIVKRNIAKSEMENVVRVLLASVIFDHELFASRTAYGNGRIKSKVKVAACPYGCSTLRDSSRRIERECDCVHGASPR